MQMGFPGNGQVVDLGYWGNVQVHSEVNQKLGSKGAMKMRFTTGHRVDRDFAKCELAEQNLKAKERRHYLALSNFTGDCPTCL